MKQAADANLVTSLSMVLPFGPAEKQALLEAADSTARAKLLVAFLEMNAFGQAARNAAETGELSLALEPNSLSSRAQRGTFPAALKVPRCARDDSVPV